jgi:hypothetical protein
MSTVLRNNPKAVVHLRQQHEAGRLGLVFGAGISKDLSFPNWNELVKDIANHGDTDGSGIYENSVKWSNTTSVTQLLFQHFKQKRLTELESEYPSVAYRDRRVLSDWRSIVHEVLYKEALIDREKKVNDHPYLKEFIPLINKAEFSVNYNFDDTLEFMISNSSWNPSSSKGKPYQAVWNPYMQFRQDAAVIYHPNGYLPGDKNLQQSEELVFSEESFSDQLLQSMSGNLSTLTHLFSKKTCLFVGLSLEDNTLKHLLRQSAAISPGNFHYFIRFTGDKDSLTPDEKAAIFNSNFEVYNLITLFLNSSEIAELASFVYMDRSNFITETNIHGVDAKYNYYLVGTVGSGKSTALSHFGGLKVFEEWMDERPSDMSRPFGELTTPEKEAVDSWVDQQFFKKNCILINEQEGIQLIDRTPIDPITFSPNDSDMADRAKRMINALAPGHSSYRTDVGHIIFIKVNPSELKSRLLSKRKTEWSENEIQLLQDRTAKIFDHVGYSAVENIARPLESMVKDIARVIFVDKYQPVDLHERLEYCAELDEKNEKA